jgi:putative MATE family efflux protein
MAQLEKSTDRIGTDKIGKLLFEFSIPAIIGLLVNAIYNTVDRIYIGQAVDPLGIAGISITMPMMLVGTALSMLIGVGANSIFAIRLGEGKKDEVEKILGHAFILLFLASGIFVILSLLFLDEIIIYILGASEAILPYAKTYLRIILYGTVFNTIGYGLNFFIRSDGHPRTSMITQLIGAVLNIILDPIFIFGFNLGIAGAAWATIIAQFISFLWVLLYFNSKSTQLRFHIRNMKLDRNLTQKIFFVGFGPFARSIAASFAFGILNHLLQLYGGDIAVTAMGVAYSIILLFTMPLQGLTISSQPIIGYNYGAELYSRVRQTYKWVIIAGSVFATVSFILIQIFPHILFGLFTKEKGEYLEMGIRSMRICFLLFPLVAFQMISSNYFTAIGKPIQSTLLSLLRQVICYIPLMFLLPRIFGLDGVFYAMPVSDCLSSIITLFFIIIEQRRIGKLIKAGQNIA